MNKAIFCLRSYLKDMAVIKNPFRKILRKVIMFNYIILLIFIFNKQWQYALVSAVASIILDFYKFAKYNGEWKKNWNENKRD